jgi:hypothetical protein
MANDLHPVLNAVTSHFTVYNAAKEISYLKWKQYNNKYNKNLKKHYYLRLSDNSYVVVLCHNRQDYYFLHCPSFNLLAPEFGI